MLLRKLQKDNRIERETWIKRHKEEQGESNVYRKNLDEDLERGTERVERAI